MKLKNKYMKHYVLGFAIDVEAGTVLLIKKQRPKWQQGSYNGIGGHIEEGETSVAAMVREFKEETNIDTVENQWEKFAKMKGEGWDCDCYRTHSVNISLAETMTDEDVEIFSIDGLIYLNTISNVGWLVHMALDLNPVSSDSTWYAEVSYS